MKFNISKYLSSEKIINKRLFFSLHSIQKEYTMSLTNQKRGVAKKTNNKIKLAI